MPANAAAVTSQQQSTNAEPHPNFSCSSSSSLPHFSFYL